MSVVLLSGGMDSAFLAYHEQAEGRLRACVFVDYGQPAATQEIESAFRVAQKLGVRIFYFEIDGLRLFSMSDEPGKPGPRVIAARNAALCSVGANVAASLGCEWVLIGCVEDDALLYPDCRGDFICAISHAMALACGVQVAAPFLTTTKRELLERASRAGVDLSESWSCYAPKPGGVPCGTCDSCRVRISAFVEFGGIDPAYCSRERD